MITTLFRDEVFKLPRYLDGGKLCFQFANQLVIDLPQPGIWLAKLLVLRWESNFVRQDNAASALIMPWPKSLAAPGRGSAD